MDPKSLSILIGDNANITCRLAKPNSSEIWFFEEKSRHSIKQPSDQIKVNVMINVINNLIKKKNNKLMPLSI